MSESLLVNGSKFDITLDVKYPFYKYPFINYNSIYPAEYDLYKFKKEKFYDFNVASPIMSFKDCINEQIDSLLAKKNYTLYLLYSGGIDSVTIATAIILRFNEFKNNNITLVAMLTTDSIIENQFFYQKKLINYFKIKNLHTFLFANENDLILTGEPGDLIYYGDYVTQLVSEGVIDILLAPFEIGAPKILYQFYGPNGQLVYEKYKDCIKYCGFKVINTHQFFWFISIFLKWNYIKYRFLTLYPFNKQKIKIENFKNFYDSKKFLDWSTNYHYTKKISTYKKESIDFIFELCPDIVLNVNKNASLLNPIRFQKITAAIDSNLSVVTNIRPYRI